MSSKKKSPKVKTTKPQPMDVREPVPAEEPESPEAEAVPGTQDPVEPVEATTPEADVPEAPVSEPKEPEAAPEGTTPDPEATPVHAKPFSAALRDPRLPEVGSVITRQYKGTVIEVTVTETGFEYDGATYSSISKVAQRVTGARAMNGYAFFRLGVAAGGKSPRTGAGTATRLAAKIARIEGLVAKLRGALEAGQTALAEAEADLTAMKEKAEQIVPKSE